MLYLILALFFSVGIVVIFRFFKSYSVNTLGAILVSYIASFILAFGSSYDGSSITQMVGSYSYWAIIIGVSFFFGFILLSLSTQKSGISITSVASNISVIIPVLVAILLYHEKIKSYQLAGLILAIPAIYLFFKPQKNTIQKWGLLLFPLGLFLINGLNNSLMRHAERLGANANPMFFLGIVFIIAFFTAVVYSISTKQTKKIQLKEILFGFLLGIFNFASTYFFLKSLSVFSSALFFPVYNLSFIGISALIGISFFKEKLSKTNYIGLAVAAMAIVLMNYKG